MARNKSPAPQKKPSPILIPGTTLEGGGQLLRLTTVLSSLTRQPLHLTSIRAGRSGGGGLKSQHLCCACFLARASNASTTGLTLGSRDLVFEPGGDGAALLFEWTALPDGRAARKVDVEVGTLGAVTLVLQAILPFLIFEAGAPTPGDEADAPAPILVTLTGGTHVPTAPTLSYTTEIFTHNINTLFPRDPPLIEPSPFHPAKLSWSAGPPSLGRASFIINPLKHDTTLQPFTLPSRTTITQTSVHLLAPTDSLPLLRDKLLPALSSLHPNVTVASSQSSHYKNRYYILVSALTDANTRIGRDALFQGSVGTGKRGTTTPEHVADLLVSKVVRELGYEIKGARPLDWRMMDQIAVFAGLAAGRSAFSPGAEAERDSAGTTDRASMHTATARWAVEEMLGADFAEDGSCEGVGFRRGLAEGGPRPRWERAQRRSREENLDRYAEYQGRKDARAAEEAAAKMQGMTLGVQW